MASQPGTQEPALHTVPSAQLVLSTQPVQVCVPRSQTRAFMQSVSSLQPGSQAPLSALQNWPMGQSASTQGPGPPVVVSPVTVEVEVEVAGSSVVAPFESVACVPPEVVGGFASVSGAAVVPDIEVVPGSLGLVGFVAAVTLVNDVDGSS
jgi:hypothetical protein